MTQPTAYSDQLHSQARDIADRLIAAATETPDAFKLATGPVAVEIGESATCCLTDQLGLAVMVIAELLRRSPATAVRDTSPPPCQPGCGIGYHLQGCRHIGLQLGIAPDGSYMHTDSDRSS